MYYYYETTLNNNINRGEMLNTKLCSQFCIENCQLHITCVATSIRFCQAVMKDVVSIQAMFHTLYLSDYTFMGLSILICCT